MLLPAISFAQSNYKPGYVVILKGDTVNGYINYKDWDKNPRNISFGNSPEGQKTEYNFKNISEFTITGFENYRSFNLWISQDYNDHERLTPWLDTTKKFDTVFLRTVTTGKYLTLYSYKDKIKQRFFISDAEAKPVELIYHVYIDTVYSTEVHTVETYKNQLQKLIAAYKPGDQNLINEVQGALYYESALSDIVFKINGTSAQHITFDRHKPNFFAGVYASSISNSVQLIGDLAGTTKASTVISPGIDIGVDIYSNKNVGKWVFRLEFSVSPDNVNINFQTLPTAITKANYNIKFKQLTTALTPQIIYNLYNTDGFKLYLDAGIGIGDNAYTSKQFTNTTTFTVSGEVNKSDLIFPTLQFLSFNVPVKAGVVINKNIDIYVGFIPKTRFNDDTDYQVNEQSFSAGVNYIFGK